MMGQGKSAQGHRGQGGRQGALLGQHAPGPSARAPGGGEPRSPAPRWCGPGSPMQFTLRPAAGQCAAKLVRSLAVAAPAGGAGEPPAEPEHLQLHGPSGPQASEPALQPVRERQLPLPVGGGWGSPEDAALALGAGGVRPFQPPAVALEVLLHRVPQQRHPAGCRQGRVGCLQAPGAARPAPQLGGQPTQRAKQPGRWAGQRRAAPAHRAGPAAETDRSRTCRSACRRTLRGSQRGTGAGRGWRWQSARSARCTRAPACPPSRARWTG